MSFMRVTAKVNSLWNTSKPTLENLIRGMDGNGIDGMSCISVGIEEAMDDTV